MLQKEDFFVKITEKTAYIMMIFSIVFEQIGTGFLEACQAFTKLTPTLCLIGAYIVSYWLFARALRCINLSIFYATWTAAGTVSAALIGIFIFHQTISLVGWIAIAGMIAGIFILNLFGTPKEQPAEMPESGGGAPQ